MTRIINTLPVRSNMEQVVRGYESIVVLDILRASTTAVVALDQGAQRIFPCGSRHEAFLLKKRLQDEGIEPLLCGERGGRRIEGFDLGNSPREFTAERISHRTLIMATTNGTRALKSAQELVEKHEKGWIAFGAFRNAAAITQRLLNQNGDCLLVASGKEGFFSMEDFVGAGLLIDLLMQAAPEEPWQLDDASGAAHELYLHHHENLLHVLLTCSHGRYLIECGFGDDLPICAEVSTSHCIPMFQNGSLMAKFT